MAEQQEILLGNAFVTDKGNWQQGATYETKFQFHKGTIRTKLSEKLLMKV